MLRTLTALAALLLSANAARAAYGCYGGYGGVGTPTAYALATVKGGQVHVRQFAINHIPETATRTRQVKQNGQVKEIAEQYTVIKAVPREIRQVFDPAKLKVTDAAGSKVGAEALAQRLKEETPVLLVFDGRELEARYRRLLKKGTLILTLSRNEAIPPAEPLKNGDDRKGGPPPGPAPKSDGPRGLQPSLAGASVDDKGVLFLRESGGTTTTQTGYREVESKGVKRKVPVKVKDVFTMMRMRSLEASGAAAQRADGKPVSAAALRALLKKEAPVLVSTDGKPVDPYYLRIIRGDTLLLVLPMPEAPVYGAPMPAPEPLLPPPGKKAKGPDVAT